MQRQWSGWAKALAGQARGRSGELGRVASWARPGRGGRERAGPVRREQAELLELVGPIWLPYFPLLSSISNIV